MSVILAGIAITIGSALILYLFRILRRWFNRTFKTPVINLVETINMMRIEQVIVTDYLMDKNGFKDFRKEAYDKAIQEKSLENLMKVKQT